MFYFLKSMRPKQWVKNLLVFSGIIFLKGPVASDKIAANISVFCLFCLLSGAVYILNDICDRRFDARHIIKSQRPIASGKLGVLPAAVGAAFIVTGVIPAGFMISAGLGSLLLSYLVINILYSFYLKRLVVIDVFAISLGFAFRIIAGYMAVGIWPNSMVIVCAIFLSLFFSLCKRRQEIALLCGSVYLHRRALVRYAIPLLNNLINFTALASVSSYVMLIIFPGRNINLIYSLPFILLGVIRYRRISMEERGAHHA